MVRRTLFAVLALFLLLLTASSISAAPTIAVSDNSEVARQQLLAEDDALAIALEHLRGNPAALSVSAADLTELAVTDLYYSKLSGLTHVYLRQELDGIPVFNGVINVSVLQNGKVLFVGNRAVARLRESANAREPRLTAVEAVEAGAQALGLTPRESIVELGSRGGAETLLSDGGISEEAIPARLVYQPVERGGLRLAWEMEIGELGGEHWWSARVDAETGALLSNVDWVTHDHWEPATSDAAQPAAAQDDAAIAEHAPVLGLLTPDAYRVYALPAESPNHTTPLPPADGRTLVSDPADATASPFGWHDNNGITGADFTTTQGNNVHAYTDTDNDNLPDVGGSPDGGATLTFDFPLDLTMAPSTYGPASVTNLFYWNNLAHDLNYHNGFDEAAGSFQTHNYGNPGIGNDSVRAEALDSIGLPATGSNRNNANFYTPPDGSRPRMQMYIWTNPNPVKDGDLDAGVILHEYGHGISNRLVGGPSNVTCLGNQEQMGEGWSDWQGLVFTARASDTATMRRGVGTYVLDQPTTGNGVRARPYSTDITIDDRTYSDTILATPPHAVGSIWTAMLWEVYWNLVDEHGFDPNFYTGTGGNNLAIQLVNEGLKLTPCGPGFVDGRDAILAADEALTGGANQCLIWEGFAKRGLGVNAIQGLATTNLDNLENFDLPAECTTVRVAPQSQAICAGDPAAYTVSVGEDFTAPVTLSATGNPAGTTAAFSPNPVGTVPSTSALTIGNTAGAAPGSYTLTVTGDDGSTTEDDTADLDVFGAAPGVPTLLAPANGATDQSLQPTFSWSAVADATSYRLEVDDDPAFGSIDFASTTSSTSTGSPLLESEETYHWRVIAINPCGETASLTAAVPSAVFSFTTRLAFCRSITLPIPDGAGPATSDSLVVADTRQLTDLDLQIYANHSWVGDLTFTLGYSDTNVTVIDRPGFAGAGDGCTFDNIQVILDDEAATPVESQCIESRLAIDGTRIPNNPLSAYDGMVMNGTWTLTIDDAASPDTGTVDAWCLLPTPATPSAAVLAAFGAVPDGEALRVTWETVSEQDNAGFNIYRGTSDAAPDRQLNGELIASEAPGGGGAQYEWVDAEVESGVTYYYWLDAVSASGDASRHGPVSATPGAPTAVTMSNVQASTGTAPLVALGLLALGLLVAGSYRYRRELSTRSNM